MVLVDSTSIVLGHAVVYYVHTDSPLFNAYIQISWFIFIWSVHSLVVRLNS